MRSVFGSAKASGLALSCAVILVHTYAFKYDSIVALNNVNNLHKITEHQPTIHGLFNALRGHQSAVVSPKLQSLARRRTADNWLTGSAIGSLAIPATDAQSRKLWYRASEIRRARRVCNRQRNTKYSACDNYTSSFGITTSCKPGLEV